MPISGPDQLLYEKKGKVVILTINRPERMNAINADLNNFLAEAWIRYDQDEDAWCAILTGAGDRSFCAGADLMDMAAEGGFGRASRRLSYPFNWSAPVHLNSWKPTIAAINGYAIAGGWFLAQYCDLRIASETAKLGIAEVKWNLPAGFVTDLKWRVSLSDALEVVLTAAQFTAQRCHEMGFVNYVVPPEKLMDKAMEIANLICENAPMSVRMHKEAMYRGLETSRDDASAASGNIMTPLRWSEDSAEGPKAFTERRKPVWKNR